MPKSDPQPPEAPSVPRRLKVRGWHAAGQIGIVLVVVLALVGAFGESHGTAQAAAEGIAVSVEFPTRIRYKTLGRLEVSIAAAETGAQGLSIAVSTDYLAGFSEVTFEPGVGLITPELTLIRVGDLAAGTERLVTGELQAERYWLHEGWLEVRRGEEAIVRVWLSTFVFP